MRIVAILKNNEHPEYGEVSIPLPIKTTEYGRSMDLLSSLGIGDALRKKEKAATTPVTGVPEIGLRTVTWRITTTSVGALHRPRNRPCSPVVCAAGMCPAQTLSGTRNTRHSNPKI